MVCGRNKKNRMLDIVDSYMISVCIPVCTMINGLELLKRNLVHLADQTYRDFEVVITDNSDDDKIQDFLKSYFLLPIRYSKSPIKGASANTNEAILQANGKLIKILYQDDYLTHKDSLKDIVEHFTGEWLITACDHDNGNERYGKMIPKYNDDIYLGKNTIGSPSVLTIKNEDPLLFDPNLVWLLDCDYYKRLFIKYGQPVILDKVTVTNGIGAHQATNRISVETKLKERDYLIKRYG